MIHHDDLVQLIASIQLFLSLLILSGLVIKLRVKENLDLEENDVLSIILIYIVLNSTVILAVFFSLYLVTPKGKELLEYAERKGYIPADLKAMNRVKVVPLNNSDVNDYLNIEGND